MTTDYEQRCADLGITRGKLGTGFPEDRPSVAVCKETNRGNGRHSQPFGEPRPEIPLPDLTHLNPPATQRAQANLAAWYESLSPEQRAAMGQARSKNLRGTSIKKAFRGQ